jgi:hypothetical protein
MWKYMHKDNKDVGSTIAGRKPLFYRISTLIVCALVVSLSLALSVASFNSTPKAHAATWNQVWGDEFNETAGTGVDTSQWIYDTGTGFGTGEVETMTNSTANVHLDGSHLAITALKNASGAWTSGRIETVNDSFGAPAGGELEITASIQQPNVSGNAALGYWPAFWTLGTPYRTDHSWPKDGEIDIMEDINGLSSVFGTLHCGVASGGPCNETTGIGSGKQPCAGCQTGFHTYTEIIDRSVSPEQIRWYLDGNNYFTVKATQVDATTWANAVDHPFYVIFDLAMGGGFPAAFGGGPTSATQSGASMLVDYVHVYTANGSTTPVVTPTTGSTPTATPTKGSTPTATPTAGSCSGTFTSGVVNSGSTSALPWFQPCGWTAGYVIVHYIRPGLSQQNVNMTYNSSTSRWEYNVTGMSSGQVLQYSFTYQKNGAQYDTSVSNWTHP